ncbi:MAG: hypothetical protein ACOCY7_01395 [Halodesulfurarchaeum sp.]
MSQTVHEPVRLPDLAAQESLPLEWLDREGLTVSVDHNPEQSLVLIESETGSRAVVAVDVSGVTLAEAIEAAREIRHTFDRLEREPFSEGGDVGR